MSEQQEDGWKEYRLLVLEMLERHETTLKEYGEHQGEARLLQETCRMQLRDDCRTMSATIRDESKSMISKMKEEIIAELKPETEIKVATITSTWEFRGIVVVAVLSFLTSLIALLK